MENPNIKNNEVAHNQASTLAPNTNANPINSETIDLRELFFKYLRKWYWFVISVIACLIVSYIYLKVTNDVYQVQTTILLRKDQSSNMLDMSMLDGLGIPSATSKEVEDEIQVLSSKTLMTNVIRSLGTETEYYVKNGLRYEELFPDTPLRLLVPNSFNDTVKQAVELRIERLEKEFKIKLIYGNKKETYRISDLNQTLSTPAGNFKLQQISTIKIGDTYKIISYPIRVLTDMYGTAIKIGAVTKKSNAINASIASASYKKSETILNKLIELYNLDAIVDKNMIASNSAAFVQERLKLIAAELLDVEMNVESYKKRNNLTDISSEAELFLKSASEYDKKLAELETQLNLIVYIENYVKDIKNQYGLIPANLGIEDKSLIELMQEYNKALLERMKLTRTTNDKNPVMTQMEQQLKELRSSIITSIASLKDGLKIARKDVLGKDAQFALKIKDVPTQERQFIEIKRQQEIKEKLYLFLLQRREENALSLASTIPSAKTVDAAYTSIIPVSPKRMMVYLLALMIGMALPLAIIYVLEMFNNKISDKKDLQKLIKVPFLGSIAYNKDADRIVVGEGKTTPIVEMFRLIRTNMNFMLSGKKSPVILVTSTISGEGKSFTAINMAISFALLNKKVVLIGLDVRNPMLGEYMHISKADGVTLYLSDPSFKTNDIIIPSGFHPYLDVIPAGPIPPNPAELLLSDRLDELIADLKTKYDYIILDSAPVGIVSDTYLINRLVDNCIYVTRQNYTPREASFLINEIYKHKRINKVAVVLNGTNESLGYGYGYGYGYSSGKNDNSKSTKSVRLNIYKRFRNK
jgi:capsular exopolysaccharide synthesis family protein